MGKVFTKEELLTKRVKKEKRVYNEETLDHDSFSPNRLVRILNQAKNRYRTGFGEIKNINEAVNGKCRQVKLKEKEKAKKQNKNTDDLHSRKK